MLEFEFLYKLFYVFCRVASIIMILPIFSSQYINNKTKIAIAILLSLSIYPVLNIQQISNNINYIDYLILLIQEILFGIFIGLTIKINILAVQTAGLIIAYQAGLSSALLFDPSSGGQKSVIADLLLIILMLLILLTDTHLLYIKLISNTYEIFPSYNYLTLEDMSISLTQIIAKSFYISLQMSLPYILIGLILNIVAGIMSRLMPTMQVFFILMPLQILVILVLMGLLVSVTMSGFIDSHQDYLVNFK